MRRARKLNALFAEEFTAQKTVLEMFDRKLEVNGCPLYAVYQAGCLQLDARLRGPTGERAKQQVTLKNMEHIKRAIENVVAKESLKLESGLIPAGHRGERGAIHGVVGHGVGRDEHVRGHRTIAHRRVAGGHGAGRFRRAGDDGGGPAGGDPLDVRL